MTIASLEIPNHKLPKISFGIIVLNGEPFIRYCIRALYPHAHQIMVVEGAIEKARNIATADGHSTDSTRETLASLKATEDPENKITVITNQGFWKDKNEMSRAYADRATGDYLWQVDSDEFYLAEDIIKIRHLLAQKTDIDGASFRWRVFWGNEKYITDGWFLRSGGGDVNRLFKWGKGFHYGKHHEGPTVTTAGGRVVNCGNWLSAIDLAQQGIYMYHLSLVFPDQVLKKSQGYAAGVCPGVDNSQMFDWAKRNWLKLENPFRTHNRYQMIAWLERYRGKLPEQVTKMFEDIRAGKIECSLREMQDVNTLEQSFSYRFRRAALSYAGRLIHRWKGTKRGHLLRQACYKWVDFGIIAVLKAVIQRLTSAVARYWKRLLLIVFNHQKGISQ